MENTRIKSLLKVTIIASSVYLGACTQTHSLPDPVYSNGEFYGQSDELGVHFNQQSVPEKVFSVEKNCVDRKHFGAVKNYRTDEPMELPHQTYAASKTNPISVHELPLSVGDLVEVQIEEGEGFNGRYVISPDGTIKLPLIRPVLAAGLAPKAVAEKLQMALIRESIFHASSALVSVHVMNLAAVEVSVTGAVFQPGRILINRTHANGIMRERTDAYGDFSVKRLLSEALRGASGIRPDAKLDQIVLIRNGWRVEVDMSGILTGSKPVADYALIAGDQVIVPSTGCFQSHLVRPSQITPKGFRVFMSNLIDSAMNNSGGSVSKYATNLPYGTRLLQAAVSANCIGGKEWTNAPRKVLLASKHPITGETQVIQRSVEQLMRSANREEINPYLMPNDAVACYDSQVTNLRAVANVISDVIAPFKLF